MDAAFTLAWRHTAGLVFPEDLPMAAAGLLGQGIGGDSPALCELAGRQGRGEPSDELTGLLHRALGELGLPVPDDEFARRCRLHHTAARLTSGEITPGEAAVALWVGSLSEPTAAERRLEEAVAEVCCPDCVETTWPAEAARNWEREMVEAAAVLAASADSPIVASWYRG
ncbi:hypothetical protein [Streptomyces sp. CBMA156]|uniref:hypothetical protein n=1 Tax=Streptomyces sp. CBMA156 TaxID=1930280 RepID=UPI001661C686|nr:hypothetical protein [Streptomyces sp. CBMA156]MBD0671562.1 hypothetical protein [Streptomyces sp. CBMA156]